jgi:hypothetical protein
MLEVWQTMSLWKGGRYMSSKPGPGHLASEERGGAS